MQYYSQGSLNGEGGADSFHHHSEAQFFLRTRAEDIGTSLCGLWKEKRKKDEILLTTPSSQLRFDQEQTAALLQSPANTIAICGASHTGAQTRTISQEIKYAQDKSSAITIS